MSRIRKALHWLGDKVDHALEGLMDLSMYLVSETILAIWGLICLICSKIYRSILMAYEGSIDIWYNNMKTENKRTRDNRERIIREREERRRLKKESRNQSRHNRVPPYIIPIQQNRNRWPPNNRV